jgi:RES domain-containing protein
VTLWRISNHALLSGDGALRASGRWHTRGQRVVYCAQSPAAALLEILVHYEIDVPDLPTRYRLLKIAGPDDLLVEEMSPSTLPPEWRARPQVTRAIGDTWLKARTSALLQVPSAVIPETMNVLLNPGHPDAARLSVTQVSDHLLDARLLK